MSTGNSAPGVGGTAQDGGLSTAGTVADGGPNVKQDVSSQYLPPGRQSKEVANEKIAGTASTSNAAPGVGGTAKDGGLSTAATVADGGPDDPSQDPTYKPST